MWIRLSPLVNVDSNSCFSLFLVFKGLVSYRDVTFICEVKEFKSCQWLLFKDSRPCLCLG